MKQIKRRKRKYKLVWPWNSIAAQQRRAKRAAQKRQQPQPVKRRRPKRKLRKEFIYAIAGVVAILLLIFVPKIKTNKALKELGYDKEQIAEIKEQKLTKTILEKKYYSPYLAACIKNKSVNLDYLPFYVVANQEKPLDSRAFLLINRLWDKGYEEDQILNLYKNLKFYELTPLLIYDYQFDETGYIEDCRSHPENSPSSFTLTKNYYTAYKNTVEADPAQGVKVLVNKTYCLNENFEPSNLSELSNYYAAAGVTLDEPAAEALKDMGDAGREVGVTFFASGGYRSYNGQNKVYHAVVNNKGPEQADLIASRPGFSELQTGLAMDVAATNEDHIPEFKDTTAFSWISMNCQDYGFILRYPQGKEAITQYEYQPWHYRYIGKDLAQKVVASGLTYDEYYCLYLKPFAHSECAPKEDILKGLTTPVQTEEPKQPKETEAATE